MRYLQLLRGTDKQGLLLPGLSRRPSASPEEGGGGSGSGQQKRRLSFADDARSVASVALRAEAPRSNLEKFFDTDSELYLLPPLLCRPSACVDACLHALGALASPASAAAGSSLALSQRTRRAAGRAGPESTGAGAPYRVPPRASLQRQRVTRRDPA
jgi:hypothetical protein